MQELSPKSVLEYFNTEERILVNLNPYLLKFMSSIYSAFGKQYLFEKSNYLPNLFTAHLGMAIFL